MGSLIVTLVGPDRPGLVGLVSDTVKQHDGNWLESRMSHLAGQFAGIIQIEASAEQEAALTEALQGLSQQGLKLVIASDAGVSSAEDGVRWQLNVTGNDRPGIVREVTQALAARGANVEELTTECSKAPQAGGMIFRAAAQVSIPSGVAVDDVQLDLENLANDLIIEFSASESP